MLSAGEPQDCAQITALRGGLIARAALKLSRNEPNVNPKLLAAYEHTVPYPRRASGTVETRAAMSQLAVEYIDAL